MQAGDTLAMHTLTPSDVAGPSSNAFRGASRAIQLATLAYTSPLEALPEVHASPALLRKLNGSRRFIAGETIAVPNVAADEKAAKPSDRPDVTVTVSKETGSLTVTAADKTVLMFAPVTVGSERDPLPLGTWKVTGIQQDPAFFYNPDLFWEPTRRMLRARSRPARTTRGPGVD